MCTDVFGTDADGVTVDGDYVAIKVSEAQQHFGRPWEYNVSILFREGFEALRKMVLTTQCALLTGRT